MSRTRTIRTIDRLARSLSATLLVASLAACGDHPPVSVDQIGYRGVGMYQVKNPRTEADLKARNVVPVGIPAIPIEAGAPLAGAVYQNVKVLKNVPAAEFGRLMASLTAWVSPSQGCAYCHNVANFAEDSVYTKIVARRMLQMTQHINSTWTPHVQNVGVTCYTCHRGNPVPSAVWFSPAQDAHASAYAGGPLDKNAPARTVALASLPNDPFDTYLLNATNIRVHADSPLRGGLGDYSMGASIKSTEATYGLMMHMSSSLGVNCTFCHNSRAFYDWAQSTPARGTAWYGIRMVRDLNSHYLLSLQGIFPAQRLGPNGDVAKLNCATCHQGVNKPLYGVSMVSTFPELQHPTDGSAPEAAPIMPAPAPAQSTPPTAAAASGSTPSGM